MEVIQNNFFRVETATFGNDNSPQSFADVYGNSGFFATKGYDAQKISRFHTFAHEYGHLLGFLHYDPKREEDNQHQVLLGFGTQPGPMAAPDGVMAGEKVSRKDIENLNLG